MSCQKVKQLRVGMFGGGVVGGGVWELIQKFTNNGRLASLGVAIKIVKVCVQNLEKDRDFSIDTDTKFVVDYDEILKDSSIDCVVEVMGGTTNAKDVVFAAINAGKHVITANKALIANYLLEIQQALLANPSSRFSYEAAVCGGIPVINTLQTAFVADEIVKVMGIMNGTTNFMLCKMADERAEYSAALKEAQQLGFAEADPTADVEGLDVQAKIALLAKLAFGKTVPVATVPTAGISKITAVDFEYAKILRCTIKLLGTAMATPADGVSKLSVFVSPAMVPLTSPLASAKGAGNMVLINSANMGASTLAGPGAGRFPTANSVVNDLVRLAQGCAVTPFPLDCEAAFAVDNNYESKFYIRIKCSDELGIIRAVGAAAEANQVSIHAILQNPINSHSDLDFVVITEKVALTNVQAFAADISKESFAKGVPLFMPMM